MADGMSFDFSEMDRLAASFDHIPSETARGLRSAIEGTAHKVRDGWRAKLAGSPHFPALPYAITYDIKVLAGARFDTNLQADIGPDKRRAQGALGNISEYGTPKTPGRGYGLAALEEQIPDFQRGIDRAIEDGLQAAGL